MNHNDLYDVCAFSCFKCSNFEHVPDPSMGENAIICNCKIYPDLKYDIDWTLEPERFYCDKQTTLYKFADKIKQQVEKINKFKEHLDCHIRLDRYKRG